MKRVFDKEGNRITEGTHVIAPIKGEHRLAKVVELKTKNLIVECDDETYRVRGNDCLIYSEPEKPKIQVTHNLQVGDWVEIDKTPITGAIGRIIHFPNPSMAMVLVPPEEWYGEHFLTPVCDVSWLTKVDDYVRIMK